MKKAENVLESPTAQETKGIDWIEETEMREIEGETKLSEEKKLRLAKIRERVRARRAASSEKKGAELMNNTIDFNVGI